MIKSLFLVELLITQNRYKPIKFIWTLNKGQQKLLQILMKIISKKSHV